MTALPELQIAVYRFFSDYGPEVTYVERPDQFGVPQQIKVKNPNRLREIHKVEYGPLGSSKTRVIAPVESLRPRTMTPAKGSADELSLLKWRIIEPKYRQWLAGQEITQDGTPLAAWHGISREQADALKFRGIHTVEQLSQLTDTHIQSYGISNLRQLRDSAQRYVTTLDKGAVEAELAEKDIKITALQDQIAEMAAVLQRMQAQMQAPVEGGLSERIENDDAFAGEEEEPKPARKRR